MQSSRDLWMKVLIKNVFTPLCCALISVGAHASLSGTASVNITSDTSANAKTMAFDEARRQIIIDTLSPYADGVALRDTVKNEKGEVLTNLISSSSIMGEQSSATSYSADITMSLNEGLVKKWLDMHGVNNWIPVGVAAENNFNLVVNLDGNLDNWANLHRIAHVNGIELNTLSIFNGEIIFSVSKSKRTNLTLVLRDAGWHYADENGDLHVTK